LHHFKKGVEIISDKKTKFLPIL